MRYTVVIPTLNEEGNIGPLVTELREDPRCSVVVSDNGSTDNTIKEAKEAGALTVVRDSGSVSDAIVTGFDYISDDLVIVMDADGSNQINLTNNDVWDDFPNWSPDGTRIAFASARDGNSEIYVIDVE